MSKEIDITGKRFGNLVAIKKVESKEYNGYKKGVWIFKCNCGNFEEKTKSSVVRGISLNCRKCGFKRAGLKNSTHRMEKTRLYQCWLDMKHRCCYRYSKNGKEYKSFKNYAGRGVKVCDEWMKSFESFRDWSFENGYNDSLTLDRIDVNGNYCPENCKWSTRKEQSVNRRTSVFVEYKGERLCLKDWAEKFNKPRYCWYNQPFKNMEKIEVLKRWEREYLHGALMLSLFFVNV